MAENKWLEYERGKAEIIRRNLSSKEYEEEIKKLCERLLHRGAESG